MEKIGEMMNIYLHQKNNNIGDLENAVKTLIATYEQQDQVGLHLFPELFLGATLYKMFAYNVHLSTVIYKA